MPGSRKSACITALMVLPAAHVGAGGNNAAESAIIDATVRSFQRQMWDIRISPDDKPVNCRSLIMQTGCSLGELTRCKNSIFETSSRDLHQARHASIGFWSQACAAVPRCLTLQIDRRSFS